MRAYAMISPLFWTRGSGKKLRGHKEAQIVAFHLMTSPSVTMVGIYHLSLPTLCHETGLTTEEALKGLAKCAEPGIDFAFYDEDEELVFVPALAKHQIGEKLKVKDHKIKGVLRALSPFKEHRFSALFLQRYSKVYHLGEEGASKSLGRDDVPDPAPVLDPVLPGESEGAPAKSAPRATGASWRRVPAGFEPDAEHAQLAAERDVDLALELANFRDHTFDTPREDPPAEFRKWLRNARPRRSPHKAQERAGGEIPETRLAARSKLLDEAKAGKHGSKAQAWYESGRKRTELADVLERGPLPPAAPASPVMQLAGGIGR